MSGTSNGSSSCCFCCLKGLNDEHLYTAEHDETQAIRCYKTVKEIPRCCDLPSAMNRTRQGSSVDFDAASARSCKCRIAISPTNVTCKGRISFQSVSKLFSKNSLFILHPATNDSLSISVNCLATVLNKPSKKLAAARNSHVTAFIRSLFPSVQHSPNCTSTCERLQLRSDLSFRVEST